VKTFQTSSRSGPAKRFSLLSSGLVATLAALVLAAPASGEAIGDLAATSSTEAAEAAVPATSEQAQPVPRAPSAAPVEAPEPEPVGSPPSGVAVVSTRPTPTGVETNAAKAIGATGQQASRLAESTGHGLGEASHDLGEAATPAIDRTPVPEAVHPQGLVDGATGQAQEILPSVAPATKAPLVPFGSSPKAAEPPTDEALSFPDPLRVDRSSRLGVVIDLGGSMREYPTESQEVATAGARASSHLPIGEALWSATAGGDSVASGNRDPLGSPTPADVPLPAPGSPGAVASGSGGPSFVPLVALLALLALAVPTTLRRLGEPAAWLPPIPFVCALERPG